MTIPPVRATQAKQSDMFYQYSQTQSFQNHNSVRIDSHLPFHYPASPGLILEALYLLNTHKSYPNLKIQSKNAINIGA